MVEIVISSGSSGFAEDKDEARGLREQKILPALQVGEKIVIDFDHVEYATQSFIHALIGAALKQYGEAVLERIEFKNCSDQLEKVIQLVVDYSLGGFAETTKDD